MTRLARPSASTDRAGFTLVESLIASVVLAIAVVGIAGTLAASYQQTREQTSAAEATQLARQLLEEISSKAFEITAGDPNVPGYSAGNQNRALYDELADYNGFTDLSTSIRTIAGSTQSFGTAGPYTRTVAVTAGPVPVGHTAPSTDFKTVKVTVTRPIGQPIIISKVFMRTKLAN